MATSRKVEENLGYCIHERLDLSTDHMLGFYFRFVTTLIHLLADRVHNVVNADCM
jgi:hypothetical protein